jgi:hypothetical protein
LRFIDSVWSKYDCSWVCLLSAYYTLITYFS